MNGTLEQRWVCLLCDRVWYENPPLYSQCPMCLVTVSSQLVNREPIKLTVSTGTYGRVAENVNLSELSEDKAAAIRAIVDGRSVIYRCGIVGGKIRTTSGPTIIGNTFDGTRINDDPVHIGSNKFTNATVQSTGAIVRNYFTS